MFQSVEILKHNFYILFTHIFICVVVCLVAKRNTSSTKRDVPPVGKLGHIATGDLDHFKNKRIHGDLLSFQCYFIHLFAKGNS